MTKNEIYQQLPSVLKRLFTWGLGGSILFLVFWYYGGLNLWGSLVSGLLSLTPGLGEISFRAGSTHDAAILCDTVIDGMHAVQLNFPVNILNLVIIEVITMLAVFPANRRGAMIKTGLWSFLLLVIYHVAHAYLQLYKMKIGPDVANQIGIFWDETTWFLIIHKLGSFDVFLVRYWGGFPIFILAFMIQHFLAFPKKASA